MNIREKAHEIAPYIIEMREDFHRHPELSFQEFRTSKVVAAELEKMGIPYKMMEPTGVVGEIKGAYPGKTIGIRGDMDALPVVEKSDVTFRSENEGVMHACGHDSHTAMMLGAAKILNGMKDTLHGNVRLIFQPAEEAAAGAKAFIKQGALDGVDAMFGIHIGAMAPIGQIGMRKGATAACCDEWKLKIKGKACHGSAPEQGVDATVCAAAVIMNLQTIVSRETAAMKPLVITCGKLESGSRFNIVSGEANMTGTNRCFDVELHHALPKEMERIIKGTCESYRCDYEFEYNMLAEVLVNNDEMEELAHAAAEKVADSKDMVVESQMGMGAEDFAEYTVVCPSSFAQVGAGGNYPHHSDYFWLDESSFEVGTALYAQVAIDYLEKNR